MKNPLFYLFCLSLLWLSAACSDDEHVPTAGDGTLTLRIPASLSTRAGEGEDASGGSSNTDATSELESGEGTVKDLWFMAYPTETGKGETLVRRLPTSSLPENSDYQEFSLTLKYGTYHVYVAANLPNISATTSEETLKNIVLSFQTETGSSATPQLPSTAQGLPMFKDCGEITISETDSKEITADLVFLCAKVKFTLEFDNTDYSKNAFGTNGFHITEINLVGAAGTSKLFNETNHNPKNLISISPFSFIYSSSTGTDGNTTNSDPWALTKAATWTHSATFYLPEYYPENIDGKNPTYLEIKGTEIKLKSDGSGYEDTPVEHTYTLPLGGDAYDYKKTPTTSFKGGNLVRGTYYDLTAQISSTGKQSLDIRLNLYNWTSETVQVLYKQTELWLSRTGIPENTDIGDHEIDADKFGPEEQIKVSSLAKDSILYKTNASEIVVKCQNKIGDKEIVLAEINAKKGNIVFHVNPNISITEFGNQTEGTAVVAVRANNLVKYVDVQYDVTPYLIVTPTYVEIVTEEGGKQEDQGWYAVKYETNLGGITIPKNILKPDESNTNGKVYITSTDEVTDMPSMETSVTLDKATGTFYLRTDGQTTSSWESAFTVTTTNTEGEQKQETVDVLVQPALGDYIIHFIAINDERNENGAGEQACIRNSTEGGGLPEEDGWKNHKIYIYTQYGMTIDQIPQSVWYFFDTSGLENKPYWPGVSMDEDTNNPGWHVYHLPVNYPGVCELTDTQKTPKPGETLIMFNSGQATVAGDNYRYTHHRYSYDMEPGVSLFDFSNREGWFVYDPTVSSYEFYSEKPEIYLASYVMYTQGDVINNWWRKYGQYTNGNRQDQILIWGDANSEVDNFKNLTTEDLIDNNGNTWHKTTLRLWAIKGKEAKNIIVKNQRKNDDAQYGILFSGRRFKDNTGYHDNDGWHEGVPDTLKSETNP